MAGFIPYTYADGMPDPFEYFKASALGEIEVGLALTLENGLLVKASGNTKPSYIGMFKGTVAEGDTIPVLRVRQDTKYETTFSAAADAVNVGDKVTVSNDGMQATATTEGGVLEVVTIRSTETGGGVIVRIS